jgi:hypothetical protein
MPVITAPWDPSLQPVAHSKKGFAGALKNRAAVITLRID